VKALTLQQFRGACAVVDAGFNVSRAATHLCTTQSAVSKTIKALEDELGASIFVRSSVRIMGLTEYGQEFVEIARGILRDAEIVVSRAQDDVKRSRGVLRIGTTHVYATYALPKVVQAFRAKYPEISVQLEQADAAEIARWVASRRVHLGLADPVPGAPAGLVTLEARRFERCIVVPPDHELLSLGMPTIADLARYPIVMHPETHVAGMKMRDLFRRHGLTPTIAIVGSNATMLKEYVAAGIGIAILHKIVIRPEDAANLATIEAPHLAPATDMQLIFREGEHPRSYVYEFAETLAPHWSRRSIACALERPPAHVAAAASAGVVDRSARAASP
jgi:DNA-binding transcriptional LysR family regulator